MCKQLKLISLIRPSDLNQKNATPQVSCYTTHHPTPPSRNSGVHDQAHRVNPSTTPRESNQYCLPFLETKQRIRVASCHRPHDQKMTLTGKSMEQTKDYYRILGVLNDAETIVIRASATGSFGEAQSHNQSGPFFFGKMFYQTANWKASYDAFASKMRSICFS